MIEEALEPPFQCRTPIGELLGRDDEVISIVQKIAPKKIIALHGTGGVGKTYLAWTIIHRLRNDGRLKELFPDGVIYHDFTENSEAESLLSNIVNSYRENSTPDLKNAALRALNHRKALLLLDSVEEAKDLKSILEIRGNACVLMTTVDEHTPCNDNIEIKPLKIDHALELIKKSVQSNEVLNSKELREICIFLGRIPLAICLAANCLGYESIKDYRQAIEQELTNRHYAYDESDRSKSVWLTINRIYHKLPGNSKQLLAILGKLGNHRMELSLLKYLTSIDKLYLFELKRYSLIRIEKNNIELTHNLVYYYARSLTLSESMLIAAARGYIKYIESIHSNNSDVLQCCELSHLMSIIKECSKQRLDNIVCELALTIIDCFPHLLTAKATLMVLDIGKTSAKNCKERYLHGGFENLLGNYYYSLGQKDNAVRHYKNALTILEDNYKHHQWIEELIIQYYNLALIYISMRDISSAMNYSEKGLNLCKNNPYYNEHKVNLLCIVAKSHSYLKDYKNSNKYLSEALSIAEGQRKMIIKQIEIHNYKTNNYLLLNDKANALSQARFAEQKIINICSPYWLSIPNYIYLARIFHLYGAPKEQDNYYQKALSTAHVNRDIENLYLIVKEFISYEKMTCVLEGYSSGFIRQIRIWNYAG